MAIGLAGGIGQALVAGANQFNQSSKEERDRKRKESIENEALDRTRKLWERDDQTRYAQNLEKAGRVLGLGDPNDPTWSMEQYEQNALDASPVTAAPKGNPVGTPTVPQDASVVGPPAPAPSSSIPNPVPGAGPVITPGATQGLGKINLGGAGAHQQGQGANPEQGAQQGPPPGWEPKDPDLQAIRAQYLPLQTQTQTDIDKIRARAGGDEDKMNAMLAAYHDIKAPQFKEIEAKVEAYQKKVHDRILTQRANKFVDAIYSGKAGDNSALEAMWPGAHFGMDKRTGLEGVILANGQFVGQEVALARRMLDAGLLPAKDYAETAIKSAKNIADLIKEKDMLSLKRSEVYAAHSNKEIEAANELGKVTGQIASLKAKGRTDEDPEVQALTAKKNRLNVPVSNVESKIAHNSAMESLNPAMAREVKDAVNASFVTGKDVMGNATFTPKIDGKSAVENFKRLQRRNPDMALAYANELIPELSKPVQDYIEQQKANAATTPKPAKQSRLAKIQGLQPVPEQEGTFKNRAGKMVRETQAGKVEVWSEKQGRWVEYTGPLS